MLFESVPQKGNSDPIKVFISKTINKTHAVHEVYPLLQFLGPEDGKCHESRYDEHCLPIAEELKDNKVFVVETSAEADCIITTPVDPELSKTIPTVILEGRDDASIHVNTREILNTRNNTRVWKWGKYNDESVYLKTCYTWYNKLYGTGRNENPEVYEINGEWCDPPPFDVSRIDVAYGLNWHRFHGYCHHIRGEEYKPSKKVIDISFIGTMAVAGLKKPHRELCVDAIAKLPHSVSKVIVTDRIDMRTFSDLMDISKICVSPWGYCEICGRDAQGLMYDCATIHPHTDMTTWPDIWADNIKCQPNFSDLPDIVEEVLDTWDSKEEEIRARGERWRAVAKMDVLAGRIRTLLDKVVC